MASRRPCRGQGSWPGKYRDTEQPVNGHPARSASAWVAGLAGTSARLGGLVDGGAALEDGGEPSPEGRRGPRAAARGE